MIFFSKLPGVRHVVAWLVPFAMVLITLCPMPVGAQEADDERRAYIVGAGDILSVTVYRAPDYSSVVEVGDDGTIVLSLIGKVEVSGLTTPAVGDAVAARLRDAGIFRAPVVNVIVQSYRSRTVSVLGAVGKPGEYPLERGQIRTSEMLARSGALLGLGGGTIQLAHGDGTRHVIAAADVLSGIADPVLSPRDTLIVNEAPNFYISGEVQKAGSYAVEPGLTIGRAIALAGGLTPRGSDNRVKITRREDGAERTFKADDAEMVSPKDLIVVGARLF